MTGKLIELLKIEGQDLVTAFQKASIQGRGTPQEVSDFRENYFNKFISNYFPFPHRVTKGIINDSYGLYSDSIDTVLISPNHPYTIDSAGKFSLILADGVDAAIELKPDISTKAELVRGLEQVQTVKKLRRVKSPIVLESRCPCHILEFSRTIPACIFSIKGNADVINTAKNIAHYYRENSIPIENQVDFVVVNNTGIIANYKYPELSLHSNKETGLFFEEWKDLTLAAFLLKLNSSFPAQANISGPILNHYTSQLTPHNFIKIQI